MCDYRKNDKCPPWSVQATKMLHDNKNKTPKMTKYLKNILYSLIKKITNSYTLKN